MVDRRHVLGQLGEARAEEYLRSLGWEILERNWRCREGEVDIIAHDPEADALVVVEVKTRAGTGYGSPFDAITYAKVRRLRQLAGIYARQCARWYRLLRVDAVALVWPRGGCCELSHARGIEER